MKCPTCGAPTRVKSTRGHIRHRSCTAGHVIITHEVVKVARGPRELKKQRVLDLLGTKWKPDAIANEAGASLSYVYKLMREEHA